MVVCCTDSREKMSHTNSRAWAWRRGRGSSINAKCSRRRDVTGKRSSSYTLPHSQPFIIKRGLIQGRKVWEWDETAPFSLLNNPQLPTPLGPHSRMWTLYIGEVGSITKYIPYVHLASTIDVIQMTNASRPYTLPLLCVIVNKIVNKNGMRTRPGYEAIKLVLHSSPL